MPSPHSLPLKPAGVGSWLLAVSLTRWNHTLSIVADATAAIVMLRWALVLWAGLAGLLVLNRLARGRVRAPQGMEWLMPLVATVLLAAFALAGLFAFVVPQLGG